MTLTRRNFLTKSGSLLLAGLAAPSLLPPLLTSRAHAAAGLTANSWQVGEFTITALLDGVVEVDEAIFTDAEPVERRALLAGAGQPEGKIRLDVNAFLVERGGKFTLIDTGTRDLYGPTLGKLPEALKGLGVDPSWIEHVVLTHMHNDHVGGLVDGAGTAIFPNAQLHVAEAEWNYWTSDETFSSTPEAGQFSFFGARSAAPAYRDRVVPFSGAAEVLPGIYPLALPGHSLAHTGFRLASGSEQAIIWGDIVVSPELQFAHPEWTSTFDADPDLAAVSRQRLFSQVAADRILVAGMHLPFPGAGLVVPRGNAFELLAP